MRRLTLILPFDIAIYAALPKAHEGPALVRCRHLDSSGRLISYPKTAV